MEAAVFNGIMDAVIALLLGAAAVGSIWLLILYFVSKWHNRAKRPTVTCYALDS